MSYFVYIEAIAIFRAGLMEMLTYEIPTENNKVCIEAARCLVSKLGSPSNDDIVFCEWLITVLDGTIKSSISEDTVVNSIYGPSSVICGICAEMKTLSNVTFYSYIACFFNC